MKKKKIYPPSVKVFAGTRFYILTKTIPKPKAESIARSYRRTGGYARVVKVRGGYVVYSKVFD